MKKIVLTRENACKLIGVVRNIVNKEADLVKYLEAYTNEGETEPEEDFAGISNGFLSEVIHAFTGYEIEVYGEVENLFACPCCGFKTLTERFDPQEGTGYDICPYCNWEDDGTTDAELYCSINKGSMVDYRKKINENFNRFYLGKWIKE